MAKRRKAGEGSLSKRKDGRWEARVVVSYDEKGMPKTKNVTAVSKAKCLEKLEKLKAELGAVTKKTVKRIYPSHIRATHLQADYSQAWTYPSEPAQCRYA